MQLPIEPHSSSPKARGIPLWTALAALLFLAVFTVAVLGYILRQATDDRKKLERQVQAWELEKSTVEIERQKTAEQARLAVARSRQADFLVQVNVAAKACNQLLVSLEELDKEATALRTSEAGAQVARFPDLVALARRLYEVDLVALPTRAQAVSRLEGARRLQSQLVTAIGTAFEPDSSIASNARADTLWANQESANVDRARAIIATLIGDAKIKVPPENTSERPSSLAAAIAELAKQDAGSRQRLIVATTSAAQTNAANTQAAAEAQRILKEAQLKADRILEEANAKAEQEDQGRRLREAAAQLEAGKNKVAVDRVRDEARKVELRAKARDPKVLSKLAPFTTPGYWQIDKVSYTKVPHSYSTLLHLGALAETQDGLQRMVDIGFYPRDKDRPRFHFKHDNRKGWQMVTKEREMVTEVQQLLIELGPTLVELGQLSD